MAERYPFYGHDKGLIVTQPRCGVFEERAMTAGELAAREPAVKIARDIYRLANYAGVCYHEIWRLIAQATDEAIRGERESLVTMLREYHMANNPPEDRTEWAHHRNEIVERIIAAIRSRSAEGAANG